MDRRIINKKGIIVISIISVGICGMLMRGNSQEVAEQKSAETIESIHTTKDNIKGSLDQTTTMQSIRITMKKIDPSKILLVNKEHRLAEDYEVDLRWLANRREQVACEIYDDLEKMLSDGTKEGLDFVVSSGYRGSQQNISLSWC